VWWELTGEETSVFQCWNCISIMAGGRGGGTLIPGVFLREIVGWVIDHGASSLVIVKPGHRGLGGNGQN